MVQPLTQHCGYRSFALERYFAEHEFTAPHLLCCSDCQPLSLRELLSLADEDSKARWDNLSLAYTDAAGLPELREEITKLYATITPSDCLVAAPEEAIFLSMKAILEPGDHVICTYPGYQSLFENARSIGCSVSYWHMVRAEDGRCVFALEDLQALFQPHTKAVIVNFPHNPTGFVPSHDLWASFHQLCKQKDVYIFSDEMYRYLEHVPGTTLASAADLNSKAIALGGMSKSLALPGLRIGWLATKDKDLLQKIQHLKDFTTICASAPSEVLALMALRKRDIILKQNLDLIRSNLDLLDEFFKQHADVFQWHRPCAGSIAFVRLKTGEGVEGFCKRCISDAGVLLAPDTMFDVDGTASSNSFRVGFGRSNLPECLQHLGAYLQQNSHPLSVLYTVTEAREVKARSQL